MIPHSRGGLTEVPNLKWTHRACNRLKHDLHLDEMLDLFSKILRHLGR